MVGKSTNGVEAWGASAPRQLHVLCCAAAKGGEPRDRAWAATPSTHNFLPGPPRAWLPLGNGCPQHRLQVGGLVVVKHLDLGTCDMGTTRAKRGVAGSRMVSGSGARGRACCRFRCVRPATLAWPSPETPTRAAHTRHDGGVVECVADQQRALARQQRDEGRVGGKAHAAGYRVLLALQRGAAVGCVAGDTRATARAQTGMCCVRCRPCLPASRPNQGPLPAWFSCHPRAHQEVGNEALQLSMSRRGARINARAARRPAQRVEHLLHPRRAVLVLQASEGDITRCSVIHCTAHRSSLTRQFEQSLWDAMNWETMQPGRAPVGQQGLAQLQRRRREGSAAAGPTRLCCKAQVVIRAQVEAALRLACQLQRPAGTRGGRRWLSNDAAAPRWPLPRLAHSGSVQAHRCLCLTAGPPCQVHCRSLPTIGPHRPYTLLAVHRRALHHIHPGRRRRAYGAVESIMDAVVHAPCVEILRKGGGAVLAQGCGGEMRDVQHACATHTVLLLLRCLPRLRNNSTNSLEWNVCCQSITRCHRASLRPACAPRNSGGWVHTPLCPAWPHWPRSKSSCGRSRAGGRRGTAPSICREAEARARARWRSGRRRAASGGAGSSGSHTLGEGERAASREPILAPHRAAGLC